MKYKEFIIPILLFLSLFACTLIENKQFINIIMTLFWLYALSTLFLCTAIYLYCFGDFDKKNLKTKLLTHWEIYQLEINVLMLSIFHHWY